MPSVSVPHLSVLLIHAIAMGSAAPVRADHMADAFVPSVRPDASLTVLGIPALELDALNDAGHGVYAFAITTPPGLGAPPHVHSNEDEIVFVASGSYEVVLGEAVSTVGAGSILYMPRGVPHAFRNPSDAESASTWIVVPGDAFRGFFRELGALPPGPPDMAKIAAIFEAYDIRLIAPPN